MNKLLPNVSSPICRMQVTHSHEISIKLWQCRSLFLPINPNLNQKSISSFGRKIITPMIAAVIAQINTAPALISLMSRILSSFSGCTTSDNRSMAELMASAAKTSPMAKKTSIHSAVEIWKSKPAMMTKTVMVQCIQALCS